MIPIDKLNPRSPAARRAARQTGTPKYRLKLFVTGTTPRSMSAILSIKQLCETHLQNRYSLEVVDIYQQPRLAKQEDIVAAPTLIRYEPTPLRRLIGSMSDAPRLMQALDLQPA